MVDLLDGDNAEIEAIADAEKLPVRPPNEIYYDVQTNNCEVAEEIILQVKKLAEAHPQASVLPAK